MTVCPKDLLDWSRKVSQNEAADEVDMRACVSRAYYSCLHSARECFNVVTDVHAPSSHKALIDDLVLRSKKPGQGRSQAALIAKHLPKLKRLRVHADYLLGTTLSHHDACRAVEAAEQVVSACSEADRLMSVGN